MKIIPTMIPGAVSVETAHIGDHRGYFYRAFCRDELNQIIGDRRIEQINISRTTSAGTVRGMHFQKGPHAEMKLIRCLRGKVWDVAVDLRKNSDTYLQWHAVELTAANRHMYVIPEGCAHGFQTLETECELLYLHTACYAPESEGGVRFDDPVLAISWPMTISEISERDKNHPLITSDFNGIFL